MKDGQYQEFGQMMKAGKRSDLNQIQKMIEDGATDLQIAREHFGAWTRTRTAIQEYRQMINPKKFTVRFALNLFKEVWQTYPFGFSTVLWGPSDIGKTSFLKARYPTSLFVSHIDDLKLFNTSEHEAIIFDDMDFKHIPRTAQIHLLDSDDDRSIHVRYGTAFIPAGTRKLFTTNEFNGNIFELSDSAIQRRVDVVEGKDFY